MEQTIEQEKWVTIGKVLVHIPMGILILDQELRVVYVNRSTTQISADPLNEKIGLMAGNGSDTATIIKDSSLGQVIEKSVLSRESQSSEVVHTCDDSTSKTIQLSTAYCETDPLMVVTLQDITGLRPESLRGNGNEKLAAVLEKAGTICHDMNQPMQVATGSLDLALLMFNGSDKDRELITEARYQMNRVVEISRKIMDLRKEYLLDGNDGQGS